eukprot:3329963-Alexandrium_andersonii.AAC.1
MSKKCLGRKSRIHSQDARTHDDAPERRPRTCGVGAEDELASKSSAVSSGMNVLKTVMGHSMPTHKT